MTPEEFEKSEKQIRSWLYQMDDRQREEIMAVTQTLTCHDNTLRVVRVSNNDLKSVLRNELGHEPSDEFLGIVRNSRTWRNLEKDMLGFAKNRLAAIVAPLKR